MSSSRALTTIIPLVETSPYSAHQKARTFASRYVQHDQYPAAIEVLFETAKELYKKGEQGSGTDLAVFLVDVYEKAGIRLDGAGADEIRGRLTQLIGLAGASGSWRKTLVDKSVAWSRSNGEWPQGDVGLHTYVGEVLIREGLYDQAEPYLLAAGTRDAARLLADTYIAWSSSANRGLFALRGVLPYLQNGNIAAARAFILLYVSKTETSSPPKITIDATTEFTPSSDPLLNFAQLAVFTCQRAAGASNKSQSPGTNPLAQPEVRRTLNEIGQLFFDIPPPRGAGNPMADMMGALFGGAPGGGAGKRVLAPAQLLVGTGSGLD
ncbi:DUF410-domain-containing protein [Hymenopellis radicata]|nr:DUF410-domain-containing protein [Hymenopellis radicata]